jgi:VWFA-related protein
VRLRRQAMRKHIEMKKKNKTVRVPLAVFALFLGCAQPGEAQDQPRTPELPVVRVNVQLVQVDVQVLEKKTGRPVGSLSREDFQLFEDGKEQRISAATRDQLPLSVVLMFDLTFTVQPVLKPLAAGALEALQHLKREDEVAVMVYAASAQLLQDFTTDREKVVEAIQRASEMESGEAAFFNEAVFRASAQLAQAKNPQSRRTIIWFTDNVPNIPSAKQHSEKDALREVYETGTVVFTLLERSAASDFFMVSFTKNPVFAPFRMHDPPGDVHKYAERTGGSVMKSGKEEVAAKLAKMIDEIRTRYTLAYYPSLPQPKGKFCVIKIRIRPEAEEREGRLVVRAKTGYYRGIIRTGEK